jgi:hypothetical protein
VLLKTAVRLSFAPTSHQSPAQRPAHVPGAVPAEREEPCIHHAGLAVSALQSEPAVPADGRHGRLKKERRAEREPDAVELIAWIVLPTICALEFRLSATPKPLVGAVLPEIVDAESWNVEPTNATIPGPVLWVIVAF